MQLWRKPWFIVRQRPRLFGGLFLLLAALGVGGWFGGWHLWARHHWQEAERANSDYDFTRARQHLENCLSVWPNDKETLFQMARVCRRAEDWEAAARYLDASERAQFDAAALGLERLLLQAQMVPGGQVEERLIRLFHSGHPQQHLIVEALVNGYIQDFQLANAYKWSTIWIDRYPEDFQARVARGHTLDLMGQTDLVVADYLKALELKPDSAWARLAVADALRRNNKLDEALPHYQAYLQRNPESLHALIGIARCLRGVNDRDGAVVHLERALAVSADHPTALFMRGQLELEAERPAQAVEWLRRAHAHAPNDEEINHTLAIALRNIGRNEEAKVHETRTRELRAKVERLDQVRRQSLADPHNAALLYEIGVLHMGLGRNADGASWLLTAVRYDPQHGPAHAALADYFEKNGDPKRAARHRRLAESATKAPGQ